MRSPTSCRDIPLLMYSLLCSHVCHANLLLESFDPPLGPLCTLPQCNDISEGPLRGALIDKVLVTQGSRG